MKSGLRWHPRHPDRQRPSRREDVVVQYGDLSEPVFLDEAEVLPEEVECHFADAVGAAEAEGELDELVDETFGIPRAARLPCLSRPPVSSKAGVSSPNSKVKRDGRRTRCCAAAPARPHRLKQHSPDSPPPR